MNTLTVPPSPNWYEDRVLACAPDNTVIYAARNDIVILENNTNIKEPATVRIITRAHSQRILLINVNKNWGEPKKLAVSTSEDKIVKIWDIETGKKVVCHDKHLSHNKIAGASFAGEDRVISVSDSGNIVVWNIASNETTLLNIFGPKESITCMSTCPHATWMSAFGTKTGLVVVADLRKNGSILRRMRGHDKEVISLSWCPAPINIFPKNPANYVGLKKKEVEAGEAQKIDETSHDFAGSGYDDFLKECDCLKSKILAVKNTDEVTNTVECSPGPDGDTLVTELSKEDKSKENQSLVEDTDTKCDDSPLEHAEAKTDDSQIMEGTNSEDLNQEEKENTQESVKNEEIKDSPNDNKIKESDEADKNIITSTALPSGSSFATEEEGKKEETPVASAKDDGNKMEDKPISSSASTSSPVKDETNKKEEVFISGSSSLQSPIKADGSTLAETDLSSEFSPVKEESVKSEDKPVSDASPGSSKDEDETGKTADEDGCAKTNKDVTRSSIKVIPAEEEPRHEYLLASAAKENNVYIWRAGTDGRMQTFLTLPFKSKSRQKVPSEKIWISLCWITPKMLLSSSKECELLAWNLPKPQDNGKLMKVVHKDHSSMIFSIAAPITIRTEYDWTSEPKYVNAWTASQDRLLLNTSITKDRKNLACYPTLGGQVICLQLSPLDPNRLAIGTADGFIKIWDLSRPNVQSIHMKGFYNKIKSKVSALAWHPTNELILAFGTMEGRIGYLDPSTNVKAPVVFQQYFKKQIYKLEWGPIKGNKENLGLYAVSEGCIAIFDPSKPNEDPFEIQAPKDIFLYTIAWMPDYSLLVVVTKEGYFIVYSSQLKMICKHYFQHRLQEVTWHPNASDPTSEYHNWFAAISNFKNIVVFKFDIESDNNDENMISIYQSESDLVHCVAWNPHEPSQLVIGCESGIAQIFDAKKSEIIATYVNPNYEGIVSAVWSPSDPDFVICGSKDNTLRVWKISENPPIFEESVLIKERKKHIKENLLVNKHPPQETEEPSTDDVASAKLRKNVKNLLLPNFYTPKNTHQSISGLKRLLTWVEQPENIAADSYTKNDILNIFGCDSAMQKLILDNESSHKKKGKHEFSATLSLFRGDISTTIKEAVEEKRVTPWIISLAPMVSPKLWQAACETYADQLNEKVDSDPLETASYYLACHKVQNAVDCLCDAAMFKEALALAKCRMLGKEVVDTIIEKWGHQVKEDGNFELAAQCYIYLGKYEEAASLLFRRADLKTLEFVVELSRKTSNEELHLAALSKYNTFKMHEEDAKKDKPLPTRQEAVLQQQNDHAKNEEENSSSEIESKIGEQNSSCASSNEVDKDTSATSNNGADKDTPGTSSNEAETDATLTETCNKMSLKGANVADEEPGSSEKKTEKDENPTSTHLMTEETLQHQDGVAGDSVRGIGVPEDSVKDETTAGGNEPRQNISAQEQ